jgi:TonB family protein
MPQLLLGLISAVLLGGCTSEIPITNGGGVHLGPQSPEVLIQITGNDEVLDKQPVPPLMGFPLVNYPLEIRRAGMTGTVLAKLHIEKDGSVSNISVIKDTIREFGDAVLSSAAKYRFLPGYRHGQATACTVLCEFRFNLGDD